MSEEVKSTMNVISPTMNWLYERHPGWTTDAELLYKYGFSKKGLVDVHGFDVRGFNDKGRDRLGCSMQDYRDPEIAGLAATFAETMSLSNKLPLALPKMMSLKDVFDDVCRGHWEVEEGVTIGPVEYAEDGRRRLYVCGGNELSIYLHWFDLDDREHNFLGFRTDVIAKLDAVDPENDFAVRVLSSTTASKHEWVERPVAFAKSGDFSDILERHISEHVAPVHRWTVTIVDGDVGPFLRAFAQAEMPEIEGDVFVAGMLAESRSHALEHIRQNANSGAVAAMADRGLELLASNELVPPLAPRI